MNKPKSRREYQILLLRVIWKKVIIPILYVVAMWTALVTAAFLIFEDLLQAAGVVSSIILFYIINAEFNKEFFGSRNDTQEQTQGE